jgi:hypothetical protein
VLSRFGLGTVLAAREVAEGLTNRNWAVRAGSGEQVFVKQILDVDRAQAARWMAPRPYAFELVRSATLTFCYGDERGLAADLVAAF